MGVTERVQKWFQDQYDEEVANMRAFWDAETKHGCWCGEGNRCQENVDGLDGCCEAHDKGYGAAGISADVMWTADGFVKGKAADIALIECAQGSDTTDPTYQGRLITLFETRVRIATVIEEWREAAKKIEEELESFKRWLLSAAETGTTPEELQQYRDFLGGVGADQEEIETLVASANLPTHGDGGGGTALA